MSEPGLSSSADASAEGPDAQRAASGEGSNAAGSDDPLSRQADPADLHADLVLETPDLDPPLAGWLEPALVRVAALAKVRGSVTLVVVDDAAMIRLHDEYHGDPTSTDVLTFDLREPAAPPEASPEIRPEIRPEKPPAIPPNIPSETPPPTPVEGDVVICLDEARRQAASHGHAVRLEVLLYAVHGLLHLVGMDDHDPDEAQQMHRREDELLVQAGFGSVYSKSKET